MSEDRFLLDMDGKRVYVGDYVKCAADHYESIRRGENRRVQDIFEDCFILNNRLSPNVNGTSKYRPDRFRLSGRHHPAHKNQDTFGYLAEVYDRQDKHKQETTTMFHLAILMMPAGTDMVDYVNGHNSNPGLIAGRNKEEIQQRIRDRLSQYPNEQWLICSGNTIGERADPPVRFRSL